MAKAFKIILVMNQNCMRHARTKGSTEGLFAHLWLRLPFTGDNTHKTIPRMSLPLLGTIAYQRQSNSAIDQTCRVLCPLVVSATVLGPQKRRVMTRRAQASSSTLTTSGFISVKPGGTMRRLTLLWEAPQLRMPYAARHIKPSTTACIDPFCTTP